jgi:hypothetical protein
MRPEAAPGAVLCAQCRTSKVQEVNSVEAATSPWWKEPDGVLARVRGDPGRPGDCAQGHALVGEADRDLCKDGRVLGNFQPGELRRLH